MIQIYREILHACILQNEGSEHGIPFAVGIIVLCAVTGIALQCVLHQDHIFPAFLISQLGFCHSPYILRPLSGQLQLRGSCCPLLGGLHIGIQIQLRNRADCFMGMLRNGAGLRAIRCIAVFFVNVIGEAAAELQTDNRLFLLQRIAGVLVDMLRDGAVQLLLLLLLHTFFRMGMYQNLRQSAN